jgi:queuine tRNA-ribosyltransferase
MFEIQYGDEKSNARAGLLKTAHGKVETPFFMPVATRAIGKYIGPFDYKEMNANAIICNAFILSLRPGIDSIKKAGGLHKFMNFDKTIFTDCGGFQMLRESFLQNSTKKGINFTNPFDNSAIFVTPEKIMEIEQTINSDVAMVLDNVSPYGASYDQFVNSLKNTMRWAEECKNYHTDKKQLLFGIVQGGFFKDLREKSAKFVSELDLDGIAIGGLAIGEPMNEMFKAIDYSMPYMSKEKIHYLMGVGSPEHLLECISKGIDCFDSVFPTQNGRHNTLFTWNGKISIKKAKYKFDLNPIDENCSCKICKNLTRSYLHHLAKIDDPEAKRYMQHHNLHFMQELMRKARTAIKEGQFEKFKKEFENNFNKKE